MFLLRNAHLIFSGNSGYFTNAWIPQIFSRYEYEGDMRNLLNWPKVVGNAFVNLGSEAIGLGNSTINGLLNTGLAISRGEYFQQLGGEFGFYANMFKDFAVDTYHYHRTTALKQQLFDFGNTFLNPLLYEGFATTAAGAALGKMASSFNFNRFKPVKVNNFLEDVPGYIDDWTGSVDDLAMQTGTVWDDIIPTANNLPNTNIPATFQIKIGNKTLWANSNATKHMGEYIVRFGGENFSTGIRSQSMLKSFYSSVDDAMMLWGKSQPGRYFGTFGRWELGINTETGVIYHALMR